MTELVGRWYVVLGFSVEIKEKISGKRSDGVFFVCILRHFVLVRLSSKGGGVGLSLAILGVPVKVKEKISCKSFRLVFFLFVFFIILFM